jgi:orotate phosphoribosyltransferase
MNVPHLFNTGEYTLHSGGKSDFIIDCQALTAEDWLALARMAQGVILFPYREVIGIPQGGLPFADALRLHASTEPGVKTVLIADDVLTTGTSMEEERALLMKERGLAPHDVLGVVFCARGPWPEWVTPLFIHGGLVGWLLGQERIRANRRQQD